MITIRKSSERGHANHGWLDSHHTFSFANYYDPNHMGFRSLRVINEDRVAPGRGFGAHSHRDMEIVTIVLEGAIEHKDSMGNKEVLRAGEIQRMTAGTGVVHSEFNASDSEPLHFLQIWIEPKQPGLAPGYEQIALNGRSNGKFAAVATPDSHTEEGAVQIHQDAGIQLAKLSEGQHAEYLLANGRHAWIHVVRGDVSVNGLKLATGDAAAVSDEPKLAFSATSDSEVLLFDLA